MLKNINSKTIYCWSCDFENYRGEGRLARFFVNYLSNNYGFKLVIKTPNIDNSSQKKINLNFAQKYLAPIQGIFWLWKQYFLKRKILYLNFNPLWNILVFLLSPPKTLFGPITGAIYKRKKIKNFDSFLRFFVLPILYILNLYILNFRKKKILFSTSLLKPIIPKIILKKCIFDFQLLYFDHLKNSIKCKNKTKDIDILFYNRNHIEKKNNFLNIIQNLHKKNYKIKVYNVGDKMNVKKIYNVGIIQHEKLKNLFFRSKFTFSSPENFLSLFTLEALAYNLKVFCIKKTKYFKKVFNTSNIINLNFNDLNQSIKIIEKNLFKKYSFQNTYIKKKLIIKLKNNFNQFVAYF